MSVNIAVIGAGVMGADHARTLHRFVSGATVGGIADVDLTRAEQTCLEIPGARPTADALELITAPDIHAVVIASHDSTHADLVRACVAAGKPVMCEKPLAPTLAEGERLIDDIGPGGAALVSLGFMRRFDPGYVALKGVTAQGELGRALMVHCISRGVSSMPGATSEFSITASTIHDLDIVPWLLDAPVTEVAWFATRQSAHAEGLQDPQFMLLRTADGVLTTIETYLNARYGYDVQCEIVAESGVTSLVEPVPLVGNHRLQRSSTFAADWRPRFADAYRLELQAWVDSINLAQPSPLATAYDGVRANQVAEALIRSMHAGGGFVAVDRARQVHSGR